MLAIRTFLGPAVRSRPRRSQSAKEKSPDQGDRDLSSSHPEEENRSEAKIAYSNSSARLFRSLRRVCPRLLQKGHTNWKRLAQGLSALGRLSAASRLLRRSELKKVTRIKRSSCTKNYQQLRITHAYSLQMVI